LKDHELKCWKDLELLKKFIIWYKEYKKEEIIQNIEFNDIKEFEENIDPIKILKSDI
jgi:hypothetical protein